MTSLYLRVIDRMLKNVLFKERVNPRHLKRKCINRFKPFKKLPPLNMFSEIEKNSQILSIRTETRLKSIHSKDRFGIVNGYELAETITLKNRALDWAVTKALGRNALISEGMPFWRDERGGFGWSNFSNSPEQAHPIIEKECISLICDYESVDQRKKWNARTKDFMQFYAEGEITGSTALEAAMRCFVLMKLGPKIDIPIELLVPRSC